jgi:hypothetical protein
MIVSIGPSSTRSEERRSTASGASIHHRRRPSPNEGGSGDCSNTSSRCHQHRPAWSLHSWMLGRPTPSMLTPTRTPRWGVAQEPRENLCCPTTRRISCILDRSEARGEEKHVSIALQKLAIIWICFAWWA